MRERAPFNSSYIPDREKLEALKKTYKHFNLAPIDISALKANLKERELSESSLVDRLEDAKELAAYFQVRFKKEFSKRGLQVAEAASDNMFVWELSFVELEPTEAALNAAATVAGVFVPGAGLTRRLATGSIAIEGIIRDGTTGEVVGAFKDRETDKSTLFSVRDFQKYSHARYAIDDWAEQFAELSATSGDVKVEDSLPITVNPF